jgi:hypothetical protein
MWRMGKSPSARGGDGEARLHARAAATTHPPHTPLPSFWIVAVDVVVVTVVGGGRGNEVLALAWPLVWPSQGIEAGRNGTCLPLCVLWPA